MGKWPAGRRVDKTSRAKEPVGASRAGRSERGSLGMTDEERARAAFAGLFNPDPTSPSAAAECSMAFVGPGPASRNVVRTARSSSCTPAGVASSSWAALTVEVPVVGGAPQEWRGPQTAATSGARPTSSVNFDRRPPGGL